MTPGTVEHEDIADAFREAALGYIDASAIKPLKVVVDGGSGMAGAMIGEAALCLADDRADLPDRAGVLTPVLALGDALLPRLRAAGIAIGRSDRSWALSRHA